MTKLINVQDYTDRSIDIFTAQTGGRIVAHDSDTDARLGSFSGMSKLRQVFPSAEVVGVELAKTGVKIYI